MGEGRKARECKCERKRVEENKGGKVIEKDILLLIAIHRGGRATRSAISVS